MKFLDVEIRKRGGQPKPKPVKQYPEYVGKDLMGLMLDFPGKTIHVGAACGCAFMFIGTPDEYFKTKCLRRVRLKKGEKGAKFKPPTPLNREIGNRKVVECYSKINPYEGIIVLVEGTEECQYWDKSEYLCRKDGPLILAYEDRYDRLHQTKACTETVAEA